MENRKIIFRQPEFNSGLPIDYKYMVKTKLILSQSQESLNYLKHCGQFGFENFFKKVSFKIYENQLWFETSEAINNY